MSDFIKISLENPKASVQKLRMQIDALRKKVPKRRGPSADVASNIEANSPGYKGFSEIARSIAADLR
jgi:hypothetical protein